MNKIATLFFLFFLMACKEVHKSPKPDILIDKDKMVDIMYDIKLISAARSKNYKKLKDSSVQTGLFIYHKYQIDSATLRQNLDYYATNSFKQFKEMEHSIQIRLEAERKILEKQVKIQDSLDKIEAEKKKKELKAVDKDSLKPILNNKKRKKKKKAAA